MISDDKIGKLINGSGSVLAVPLDATVTEAAEIMRDNNIGCVLIKDDEGRIEGILTERDIIYKVVAISGDPDDYVVSHIMSTNVLTCTADTSVKEVQQTMAENGLRHLPVVDDVGIPIGVISTRDIAAQQLTRAEQVIRAQGVALQDLEQQHPGISQIETDKAGRIVI